MVKSEFKIGSAFYSPIDVKQRTKELYGDLDKDHFRVAREHVKSALDEFEAADKGQSTEFDLYDAIDHLTAAYFFIEALVHVKLKKRVMLFFNDKVDICEDKLEAYDPSIKIAVLVYNMYHFMNDAHQEKWHEYASKNLEMFKEYLFKRYRCEVYDEVTGAKLYEIPNGLYKRLSSISPDYAAEINVSEIDGDVEADAPDEERKKYTYRVATERGEAYCKEYFHKIENDVKGALSLIRMSEPGANIK